MRQSVDYEADYGHVDAHAQQVIGDLDKGTGCYGGVYMDFFKQQRQQCSPKSSDEHQREHTAGNGVCDRIGPSERERVVCQY